MGDIMEFKETFITRMWIAGANTHVLTVPQIIIKEFKGSTEEYLLKFPVERMKHIGSYTYNAILCFCFGFRKPIVDINIARIITRYHRIDMPKDLRQQWIWDLAEELLPKQNFIEYNYGMLDIGALYCRNNSKCEKCPLEISCLKGCM